MKSTDEFFSRLIIKQPFATGSGTPVTVIGNDVTDEESNVYDMNVIQGFAPRYANPISDNGRFVTRGDMNAIGNLASQTPFYFQAGGLNTFDQKFASVIGGYPKDAVLDYLVGTRLYKVVSLHDDNLVDFTGAKPQFDNIAEGGVDNENWAYANMDAPVDTNVFGCNLPHSVGMESSNVVGSFIAAANGYLIADGTFKAQTMYAGTWSGTWGGAHIWAKKDPSPSTDIGAPTPGAGHSGWSPFYCLTDYGANFATSAFKVEAGSRYFIALTCGKIRGDAPATEAYFVPMVEDIDMKVYIV